jgi:hypothetical protein
VDERKRERDQSNQKMIEMEGGPRRLNIKIMSVLKVKHPINGIENSTEEGNTGENFPEMRER